MAIADGLMCQVYPVTGETVIKNIIDDSTFSPTGAGSLALVDEGGTDAWEVTGALTLSQLLGASHVINRSLDNTGMTIAVRIKITSWGSSDFEDLIGIGPGTASNGLKLTKNTTGALRTRIGTQFSLNLTGETFTDTIRTIVFKLTTSAASAEVPYAWVDTVGRVGTAADFTNAGGTMNTATYTMDTPYFNCPSGGVYRVLDYAVWDRELSDSEASSVADDYRTVMPSPAASTSAAVTGTATASIDEGDIVTGGKTIILTLTGDTFVAAGTGPIGSTADTQAIIDGLNSAQSETFGWNAEVRDKEVTTAVVRTSDTVATITLTAAASYDITATETITVTIPAVALTLAAPIVATPTFTVSATAADPVITTEPLVNNTGTVLASTGSITADVYSLSDGSLVLRSTGLTTDASGILEISDAMLSSATEYKVVFQIGTDDGVARYTAV